MKIHIYGSCVSRDILNFDKEKILQVVGYDGRSSFATLAPQNISKTVPENFYDSVRSIESNFQRRMVEFDFNNNVLQSIQHSEYDILLIDLIDNRFNLGEVGSKNITISSAFALSKIKPSNYINKYTNRFLEEWYKGVDSFFDTIDRTVGLEGIRLNKVYWAETGTDSLTTRIINSRWDIEKNNDLLDIFYDYLDKILPKSNVIEVPRELFVANPNHQWGVAPFHYIDDYYTTMIKRLKNN